MWFKKQGGNLFHFWEVPYSTIAYFEICAQYNSC